MLDQQYRLANESRAVNSSLIEPSRVVNVFRGLVVYDISMLLGPGHLIGVASIHCLRNIPFRACILQV